MIIDYNLFLFSLNQNLSVGKLHVYAACPVHLVSCRLCCTDSRTSGFSGSNYAK